MFRAPRTAASSGRRQLPQFRHGGRQSGPERRRRICRRSRPLSSLYLARLPVGAPHADLSSTRKPRQCDFGFARRAALRQDRLGIRQRDTAARADNVNGKIDARRNLSPRRSALYRPRFGAGAVGQEAAHHRQQRIVRNHPHVEFGVQCVHQRPHRLLSRRIARRDRPHQRGRLPDRQQRRLSRRLRHQPGRL